MLWVSNSVGQSPNLYQFVVDKDCDISLIALYKFTTVVSLHAKYREQYNY